MLFLAVLFYTKTGGAEILESLIKMKKVQFPLKDVFGLSALPSAVRTVGEVLLPPVLGLPALLILTAVHFFHISAVKWSFVDWNTLLKSEPQTGGSLKRPPR